MRCQGLLQGLSSGLASEEKAAGISKHRLDAGGTVSNAVAYQAASDAYIAQLTAAVMEVLERARRLLSAFAECAVGIHDGEMGQLLRALSNATMGLVSVDPKDICLDLPGLLCNEVIRPQLRSLTAEVWSILNESVFDVAYMK